MRKNLPLAVTILSVVIIAYYYFQAIDTNEYKMTIQEARERRVLSLVDDSLDIQESRIQYFNIEKKDKVPAIFFPFDIQDTIDLSYCFENVSCQFLRVGKIKFKYSSKNTFELTVYKDLSNTSKSLYIVPFSDKTTSNSTSQYGRILSIPEDLNSIEFIDFNLSYNPYTEYSVIYNCLAVPEENQLPFSIEAGEKKYQ